MCLRCGLGEWAEIKQRGGGAEWWDEWACDGQVRWVWAGGVGRREGEEVTWLMINR